MPVGWLGLHVPHTMAGGRGTGMGVGEPKWGKRGRASPLNHYSQLMLYNDLFAWGLKDFAVTASAGCIVSLPYEVVDLASDAVAYMSAHVNRLSFFQRSCQADFRLYGLKHPLDSHFMRMTVLDLNHNIIWHDTAQ